MTILESYKVPVVIVCIIILLIALYPYYHTFMSNLKSKNEQETSRENKKQEEETLRQNKLEEEITKRMKIDLQNKLLDYLTLQLQCPLDPSIKEHYQEMLNSMIENMIDSPSISDHDSAQKIESFQPPDKAHSTTETELNEKLNHNKKEEMKIVNLFKRKSKD